MIQLSKQNGFTMVELMLAMAFLSMLMLAIALLVFQISSIYNKGLTIRSINEAGQTVASDMQRTMNISRAVRSVTDAGGGRLCADDIVYAWNYQDSVGTVNAFNKTVSNDNTLRLVKFSPMGVASSTDYCAPDPVTGYAAIPNINTALLDSDENIILHSFSYEGRTVTGDATQMLHEISFLLGTDDRKFLDDTGCAAPASSVDDEYCAVNRFNFITRTNQ